MKEKFFPWILCSRPKTLIASLSPVIIGTVLAWSEKSFHLWIFLLTLLTGFGIQIATNIANDLFDFLKAADTKERVGPIRAAQSGLLAIPQIKQGLIITLLATALLGIGLIFRGGIYIALLLSLALAFAILYTAGPYPIAYLGLGECFVFIFFGPVATFCTYYLQTLHLSFLPLLAGLCPGSIGSALLIMNNLRDHIQDHQAKKKTLIVRFGTTFGKGEYALCILFPILVANIICKKHLLVHCTLLASLPAIALIYEIYKAKTPQDFAYLFPKTAQFFVLFTFLFCLGWIL